MSKETVLEELEELCDCDQSYTDDHECRPVDRARCDLSEYFDQYTPHTILSAFAIWLRDYADSLPPNSDEATKRHWLGEAELMAECAGRFA